MAAGDSQTTFESMLNQATDPNNEGDRWDSIQAFCQLVNQEPDGPQAAIRLLVHKIQSPQEKEALQALTVLEACMNNCGKRFHTEVTKFRFLNELIKILTPKYFGAWTAQKVKDRVTQVLYGWTLWLKEEPKIQEAYCMLKKQGIVKKDPQLPDTIIMAPTTQRAKHSVFDQDDKSKLLARLLNSGRPEDLETANRLIKSTIKEEQEKAEKVAKRDSTLNEVERSTKQLRKMLEQQTLSETSLQERHDLKVLYESCDRLRPNLFRLASDTVDDDEALAKILAANDELTLAINAYKERVGRGESVRRSKSEEAESDNNALSSCREMKSYHLIDLSALDPPADSPPSFESSAFFSSHLESSFHPIVDQDFTELDLISKCSQDAPTAYLDKLMQCNGDVQMWSDDQSRSKSPLLRARGCSGNSLSWNGTDTCSQNPQVSDPESHNALHELSPLKSEGSLCPPHLLTNILVPMETIKSSQLEPITLFNQGGIHVSLHFTKHSPPGRPSVAVVVISTVNTSALTVSNVLFQAAVPKTMCVKLQPASSTHLPAYNPLLPPPAISQVLLLANPQMRKVRLRYKLTLSHGDQQLDETGEIHNFPDWSSLIRQ